jgi:hypothetical protein
MNNHSISQEVVQKKEASNSKKEKQADGKKKEHEI